MANPFDKFDEPIATGNAFDRFDVEERKKSKNFFSDMSLKNVPKNAGNLAAGLVRGAGSIGSTLLAPIDIAKDALNGKGLSLESNRQRRADIDAGLQSMGANPESGFYKTGKISAEILGTLPIGGVLGKAVSRAAPNLGSAISSGGFTRGAIDKGVLRNGLTRTAGGAVNGAAAAGIVDPEMAVTGAAIGGALPSAAKVAGGVGGALKNTLYDPLMNKPKIVTNALYRAIGPDNIDEVMRELYTKPKTAGVKFSAGQASGNPAINALEDTYKSINAGGVLNANAQQNRNVLAGVYDNIAQDENAINAAISARRNATAPIYKGIEDKLFTGGEDLSKLISRARPSGALGDANLIAATEGRKFSLPVVERNADALREGENAIPMPNVGYLPTQATQADNSVGIMPYLRGNGGINISHMRDLLGEKATNRAGVQVGTFTSNGQGLDDAVMSAVEGNYLPESVLDEVDGGVQALRDMIQAESLGQKARTLDDPNAFMELASKYAGEAPEQPLYAYDEIGKAIKPDTPIDEIVGMAIKGGDLVAVKKGIDSAIEKASNATKPALMQLKNDYVSWLESQSPDFMKANNLHAQLSKPINKMQIGTALKNKLIPSTSGDMPASLNAASLATALRNKDQLAKTATGFSGAKMSNVFDPSELNQIMGVSDDASLIAEMNKLGSGYGSATSRRLSGTNFIGDYISNNNPIASKLVGGITGLPGINYLSKGLLGAGNLIGKKIDEKMAMQLENMLADPNLTQKALQDLIKKQQATNSLLLKARPSGAYGGISGLLGAD